MFSKVLVANDGSSGGRKALEAAIELAQRISAPLHMVMVEELPLFPASIDEIEEEQDEANHRFAPVIETAQAEARARSDDRDACGPWPRRRGGGGPDP